MDDLSNVLRRAKIGCSINGVVSNHLMYADDTCLIAPSPSALQNLLKICSEFASVNSVVFNESKTWLMCCKPSCYSNLYVPDIELNGEPITLIKEHKYLGILLNDKLNDELDMK